MIRLVWRFSWPHLRTVLLFIVVCSFFVQVYLYSDRENLLTLYTPATESELYCVSPSVEKIEYHGNGEISLKIGGVKAQVKYGDQRISNINQDHLLAINLTLREGFNSINFDIDGNAYRWNAMYTPSNYYDAIGNSAGRIPGVVSLYPSSLCTGKPILTNEQWTPKTGANNSKVVDNKPDVWRKTYIDAIQRIEDVRGIPDEAIETADINSVIQRLEDKTSHEWCTQIALYTAAKMGGELPVRVVSNGGVLNSNKSISTGGHAFLEYLDPKTNKWALADPKNYIFSVIDKADSPLNALELTRLFSLPNQIGIDELRFNVVSPASGDITTKDFHELPFDVQRDLIFYFRSVNVLQYQSGSSSVFNKSIFNKINDWYLPNRRFVNYIKVPTMSIAGIRLITFWSLIVGICALVVFQVVWWKRKRIYECVATIFK